jgi:putative ABC transport system ATP-binding protein
MIELVDVSKTYNAGKPSAFSAVSGVTLKIRPNECTVFKGPSGSGKTTLLCLAGCMTRPTAGRIHFKGREVTNLPERFLTPIRRDSFGFVFQNHLLIEGMSVLENVMVPAYPTGKPSDGIKRRAERLLDGLRMLPDALTNVEELSVGKRQRTAIARALINDPEVIVADEPTARLDARLAAEFLEIAAGLLEEGKTILIASHDPLVCEADLVDSVVELRDGRVINGDAGK